MKKFFLIAFLLSANESAYDPEIPMADELPSTERINTAPTRVPDQDNGTTDGAIIEKEEAPEDVVDKSEKEKRKKKIKEGKVSPLEVY
jgi:hypothetical protein